MELDPTTGDGVGDTAKALADGTRRHVLRLIQSASRPVGVRDLAEELGLHPNAVRKHLAVLRRAGLVLEHEERSGNVGRPRLCYVPDPASAGRLGGWNPYEQLAVLLTTVASGRPAREVGEAYGRSLAAEQPEATVLDLVTAVMARHGFEPTAEDPTPGADDVLVLGRCPYSSAATVHPLVCALHEGIAAGIAGARGPHDVVLERRPPHQAGCVLTIHPSTSTGGTER